MLEMLVSPSFLILILNCDGLTLLAERSFTDSPGCGWAAIVASSDSILQFYSN